MGILLKRGICLSCNVTVIHECLLLLIGEGCLELLPNSAIFNPSTSIIYGNAQASKGCKLRWSEAWISSLDRGGWREPF